MVEPVQTQQPEPVVDPQAEPKAEPSLLDRVDKFIDTNKEQVTDDKRDADGKVDFNYAELEKIEDPKAREWAKQAHRSFQTAFNEKFQELADLRKGFESKSGQPAHWTADKVQELLKDPTFVQSAQLVAGANQNPSGSGLTDEEWSALNDKEKAQLATMQNKITALESASMKALSASQDAELRRKYNNYSPQAVDGLLSDLMSQKVQATREHLHKVLDYDAMEQRWKAKCEASYKLGRKDASDGVEEKVNSVSMTGVNARPANIPVKAEGENSLSFFQRISRQRLAESKGSTQART